MSVVKVKFTNCYRLLEVAHPNLSGQFSREWDRKYHRVTGKNSASTYIQPAQGGSQLEARSIPLADGLPEEITETLSHDEALYLLFSDRFDVVYVGITTKGIENGVFGRGRLIHHVRKLVASSTEATSHTKGWTQHAVERYEQILNSLDAGGQPSTEDLLGDIWVAIGVSADQWQSRNHEGTVLDHFKERIGEMTGRPFQILNSARVKNEPVIVQEPPNLSKVSPALSGG